MAYSLYPVLSSWLLRMQTPDVKRAARWQSSSSSSGRTTANSKQKNKSAGVNRGTEKYSSLSPYPFISVCDVECAIKCNYGHASDTPTITIMDRYAVSFDFFLPCPIAWNNTHLQRRRVSCCPSSTSGSCSSGNVTVGGAPGHAPILMRGRQSDLLRRLGIHWKMYVNVNVLQTEKIFIIERNEKWTI